jgi:hypothetical protein
VSFCPAASFAAIIVWQLKSFGFTDTCGVHNLHGIPGVIACVCGAIAAASFDLKDGLPFSLNYIQARHNAATRSQSLIT